MYNPVLNRIFLQLVIFIFYVVSRTTRAQGFHELTGREPRMGRLYTGAMEPAE